MGFETEGQGWMRIAYFVNEWINIYVYTLFRLQGRGAQLHEPVERCWGGDPQERQVYTGPTTQTVRICTVYEQYSTVQYSTVQYSAVQYSTQYKQLISLRSLTLPLGRLEHANSLTGKL